MASLLERMDIAPARGEGARGRGARAAAAPYTRRRADADSVWQHDMYNGPGKTLSSRLSNASTSGAAPRVNVNAAAIALREAAEASGLAIKGSASTGANVVEVDGLVTGTTAADVEAIFKRCGVITNAAVTKTRGETVTVRLTFKKAESAKMAVQKFNGQSADGRILKVTVVGSANATLGGRLGGAGVANGTVDALMDEDVVTGGSKMRSDDVLKTDPRASVLTIPPGVNPAEYRQAGGRGRGGRGGRSRGGRRGGT